MAEFVIQLENVVMHAFHGVFDFERSGGNDFDINLSVHYHAPGLEVIMEDNLDRTLCYASLFEIVKNEMSVPRNLLETVTASICHKIKDTFPEATHIECKLTKLHPPIKEFTGKTSVTYVIS